MSALQGLRVIDLSPSRVGAQVSQLFSDFGAEVFWIEPPGGAALRRQPAFPFWARGKQSLEVDLQSEPGRERIRELAASADVLIESFRPGVLDRHGLGFERLSSANPRLVFTSITGFGRVGPAANIKGYEGLVAARIGLMNAFARVLPDGRPPFLTAPWCSFSASQVALHGTLAALFERESSGRGQHVETSLAQAVLALDTWGWFENLVDKKWPGAYERVPNFDADGVPTGPFPFFLLAGLTRDGHWLQFAQVAPRLFQALIKALELDFLFSDPEWKGFPMLEDPAKRSAAWSLLLERVHAKSLAEWQAIFELDPNVFAEPYRPGAAALDHRQLAADGFVVEIEDAERGRVRQPGALVTMQSTPARLGRSAPRSNEHDPSLFGSPPTAPSEIESAVVSPAGAPQDATGRAASAPPLEGVTILELAGLYAAPYGSTLLTDLGARVIKIEPLEGDPIRTIIPFPESGGAKVMQGKQSICIDIASPDGLALVHELVGRADVVMQGFRAGVAERLGLGYERLRAIKPDLVYLNAQGYGNDGPDGHRPAYAPSFGAAAGIALANVGPLLPEQKKGDLDRIRAGSRLLTQGGTVVHAQADGFAALGVASALVLGLLARARAGTGQEMSATMLNTNVHAMSAQAVESAGGPGAPAADPALRGLSALYRCYDAADGWIFLAAPEPREWNALAKALAPFNDLDADARFSTPEARAENDAPLVDALSTVFKTREKADWEAELLAADVGCVAVATSAVEDVLMDPEFGRASDYLVDVVHPTFDEHPRLAPLVRFSRSSTRAEPGVLAGSHTDAILEELGRDGAGIEDLRARKVVA